MGRSDYFLGLLKMLQFGNQLTDVKGLEKLTQLRTLDLNSNQLTSVKGLEKLTQLTYLRLSQNQLTNVKGLEKLTQLKVLYLQYNPDLTKTQIAELQKALPNCDIISNAKKQIIPRRESPLGLTWRSRYGIGSSPKRYR